MDFVRSLDSSKLLLYGTILSFTMTVTSSVSYNFPLFLFGTYIQEQTEAVQSLQTFTGLLLFSVISDLVVLFRQPQNFGSALLIVLLVLLKVPTILAFSTALRQRGGELGLGIGGTNLQGATIWAMPGGFTSSTRDGYQPVDDDATFVRPSHHNAPASHAAPPPQQAPSQPPPGAYQTV
ncbi:hypothetical protein FA15DRAFT_662407 [Coprinopsis marcescibilis]|uniref:Uncharacterized protein n=1 Tax=Coprinopsis marcescibilis TaxID=230819 RepID=A0A5C3LCD0_COPMA|nr:hypothetical protein FA15DRAFT_662407 [Coprinopsis marcescibilis]